MRACSRMARAAATKTLCAISAQTPPPAKAMATDAAMPMALPTGRLREIGKASPAPDQAGENVGMAGEKGGEHADWQRPDELRLVIGARQREPEWDRQQHAGEAGQPAGCQGRAQMGESQHLALRQSLLERRADDDAGERHHGQGQSRDAEIARAEAARQHSRARGEHGDAPDRVDARPAEPFQHTMTQISAPGAAAWQ